MELVAVGGLILLYIIVKRCRNALAKNREKRRTEEKYLHNCQKFCRHISNNPISLMRKAEIEELIDDWKIVYDNEIGQQESCISRTDVNEFKKGYEQLLAELAKKKNIKEMTTQREFNEYIYDDYYYKSAQEAIDDIQASNTTIPLVAAEYLVKRLIKMNVGGYIERDFIRETEFIEIDSETVTEEWVKGFFSKVIQYLSLPSITLSILKEKKSQKIMRLVSIKEMDIKDQ